jgi:hypothetical protein
MIPVALAACLVGLVASPGRAAVSGGVERLDAFLNGGAAPGASTGEPEAFMSDFTNAEAGTARVLATTPDGEQLVAVKATMHGEPYACFDYGHQYGECDPIGQTPSLFAHSPLALAVGTLSRNPDRDVLWALAADEVAAVQLVYADGSTEPQQSVNNGVAVLFDPNRRASTLVAYDNEGSRIGSIHIDDQNLLG